MNKGPALRSLTQAQRFPTTPMVTREVSSRKSCPDIPAHVKTRIPSRPNELSEYAQQRQVAN
jgi:hypothetical protein